MLISRSTAGRNVRDLKSQVKVLQESLSSTSAGTTTPVEGDALAPSLGSSSPATGAYLQVQEDWRTSDLEEWCCAMSPAQELSEDCLQWPADLDPDLVASASASNSSPAVTPEIIPFSSSYKIGHVMPWCLPTVSNGFSCTGLDDMIACPQLVPSPTATDTQTSCLLPSTVVDSSPTMLSTNLRGEQIPDIHEPLIHLAITRGSVDALRLLLRNHPSSVNVRDKAGYTPLQRAVINGRTDLMSLLIEHNADLT